LIPAKTRRRRAPIVQDLPTQLSSGTDQAELEDITTDWVPREED
jgi:hypothetical protein